MKLDLRPLLAGDRLLEFDYELPLTVDPDNSASFLWGVSFPSPMKVKGDITNTAGYMRMRLEMSVDYSAECARCLSPVSDSFSLSLEKTVATKEVLAGVDEDRLDDYAIIENGFLDMDEQLMEQLEMEFPVRILCSEDCRGLCAGCGADLNKEACRCTKKEIDPRLAKLADLLATMPDDEE